MRIFLNCAISACLLGLAGVNLVINPFLPGAYAQAESPCEGTPPCAECECCQAELVWICDCDGDGYTD